MSLVFVGDFHTLKGEKVTAIDIVEALSSMIMQQEKFLFVI